MILIFGGAYQGKLDYALKEYDMTEKQVHHCDMDSFNIDFDKEIIADFENFALACVKNDLEAKACLEENIEKFRNKIIICNDVSQGIVPMDKLERKYREMSGRVLVYLGQEADQVIRVFAGIGSRVK